MKNLFIAQVNAGTTSAPLIGYLCNNGQVSNSYQAGTIEFDTEEDARKAAEEAGKQVMKVIKV